MRFLESDGTPAVERFISYGGATDRRTDAEGWLVVDPAPLDPVRFYTWPKGMDRQAVQNQTGQDRARRDAMLVTLESVQMPSGQKEAEVTLRLPPGKE